MRVEKPDWLIQTEGILETLNEGVIIIDDCNNIVYYNECFAQMSRYSREQMDRFLGRSPDFFYSGDDLAYIRKQIARSHQHGQNRYEFFLPRADGVRIPVVIGSRVVEDLEGRQFEIVTFTDITEQKRAEENLRAANAKLEERQREIDLELSLAERVQQTLAPQELRWGRVAVETYYVPVRNIGGDFGLVTPLGDSALNLLVCDVSGHGISSALIANRIYSETVSLLERRAPLDHMLHRLNSFVLHQIRTTGFFFTLAAIRLEDHGHRLQFAGAGHPPAVLVNPRGDCRLLEARSAVLGLFDDAVAENPVEELALNPGDRVVLYTDGLCEVFNSSEDILGIERLRDIVAKNVASPLPQMKQAILDCVAQWRHGPVTDDTSLVLLELR